MHCFVFFNAFSPHRPMQTLSEKQMQRRSSCSSTPMQMPSRVYGMTQESGSVMTGGENTSSQIPQNSECILNLSPSIRKKNHNETSLMCQLFLLHTNEIKWRTNGALTEVFCFSDFSHQEKGTNILMCILEFQKRS